jgi:hypothetical protein
VKNGQSQESFGFSFIADGDFCNKLNLVRSAQLNIDIHARPRNSGATFSTLSPTTEPNTPFAIMRDGVTNKPHSEGSSVCENALDRRASKLYQIVISPIQRAQEH